MLDIKISVIVPVYNLESYIADCLQSIIEQDFADMEIIVVNDGSTDGTLAVVEGFAKQDERIFVINKSNGGVASARNTGVRAATGKYVFQIDGDDWIEPGYFKAMYDFSEQENLDIVLTDHYFDGLDGKQIYNKEMANINSLVFSNQEYWREFFTYGFFIHSDKLIKRKLYFENNIEYPTDLKIGEDAVVICKLIYFAKKIGKINQAYFHYARRPGSAMTASTYYSRAVENYKICEQLQSFFADKPEFHTADFLDWQVIQLYNLAVYGKNEWAQKEFINWSKSCRREINNRSINKYAKILQRFPCLWLFKILVIIKNMQIRCSSKKNQ